MNKQKRHKILEQSGQLKKEYCPAIYFDSSILIDYLTVTGLENPYNWIDREIEREKEPTYYENVREIIHSEKKADDAIELRRKIILHNNTLKVTPVTSSFAILELIEWYAEHTFRNIASTVSSAKYIQRKSKKDIGEYLKQLHKKRQEETEKRRQQHRSLSKTPLASLINDLWLDIDFLFDEALRDIMIVDIINFNLPLEQVFGEPEYCALLQLGAADIIHLLLASHLGCKYFGSLDTDFGRAKDIVNTELGIIVLEKIDEILEIL
jgi:hypothetical protein